MSVDLDTFDTISQAIISALNTDISDLKTIDLYEGQFEQDPPKIIHHLPAVFVNLADVSPGGESADGTIANLAVTWDLYIAARNLRSIKTNRKTLWGFILASMDSLQGNDLNMKHSFLDFTDAEQVVNLPAIIVYRVSFKQNVKI